ncbi:MAG: hypothetical protein EAZ37_10405 [Burkholderiales bacterium]|nr:MAG: hypothetical protein EAZ37_10405 [Burkholderiales bacterium]
MILKDYNSNGKWAVEAVQARYANYVANIGIAQPLQLIPREHVQGEARWIFPIMDAVIEGIKTGDLACSRIGVEFIEEDQFFAFGANLKARTARALRQSTLPQDLVVRIRARIVNMLRNGNTPREFREYIKLLRRVGFSELWPKIEVSSAHSNKHTAHYYNYLRAVHQHLPSVVSPKK